MYKGCRHLDYNKDRYPECELLELPDGVKYWRRPKYYDGQRTMVQFCRRRGRINDVFSCVLGERDCFEPQEKDTP